MNRKHLLGAVLITIWLLSFAIAGFCQNTPLPTVDISIPSDPGDRVTSNLGITDGLAVGTPIKDIYQLGPGDVLSINVKGRATLNYLANPNAANGEDPNQVTVSPTGDIFLPLVGSLEAKGKTITELESSIRSSLAKYLKNFEVSVSLAKVRTLSVWVGGEVEKAGPQMLPAVSSASIAVLSAGVRNTGSVRRVELIRGNTKHILDLYKVIVLGDVGADVALQQDDIIQVSPVVKSVQISGEITRTGSYEMVGVSGKQESFCVRDLLELARGTTPSAALDKAFIERIGEDGKKRAINVSLQSNSSDMDMSMQSGDKLVIPSIIAFQPMIRLIGEFRGSGVYQRIIGQEGVESVQNKSGIYFLKQGQTVRDVIAVTGGVTPQADLKRAHIERQENGVVRHIPIDLERLLILDDKTADVELANGDNLVLPAVADKVHVFGEVKQPGSYAYSPNRHLIDYIGDASGPTQIAKLTDVSVVRTVGDKNKIIKLNAKSAIRGSSQNGNPVLEPGDIVYVPSKFVSGWRDALQMLMSGLSLATLFRN